MPAITTNDKQLTRDIMVEGEEEEGEDTFNPLSVLVVVLVEDEYARLLSYGTILTLSYHRKLSFRNL